MTMISVVAMELTIVVVALVLILRMALAVAKKLTEPPTKDAAKQESAILASMGVKSQEAEE